LTTYLKGTEQGLTPVPFPEVVMVQPKKNGFSEFLRTQVEVVQGRITEFQKEADKLASELSSRGQQQIKELEKLVQKLDGLPIADRSAEIADKAKHLGEEFVSHFDDLQGKIVNFVGVATRDQVAELARELKQLSKKIDGITRGAKSTRPRA
jgi:predicted transcriptional regulator